MPSPPSCERAELIQRLFNEVADLDDTACTAHLEAACPDNTGIRREVESLRDAFRDSRGVQVRHDLERLPLAAPMPSSHPVEHTASDALEMQGRSVKHYQIQEQLGKGGMGVVYKAHDTRLDRPVALKFLPSHLSTDDRAITRFIQEAKAASALDHPCICTIYETDEDEERDGQTFIAMAYYPGETLKRLLSRESLPIEEALHLAIQMARGLTRAHAGGIIHRDIKPANIMVLEAPPGENHRPVKILDFGIAKVAATNGTTTKGTALGTTAYMSPEQANGETVDHRTDIWSLGVVLYEMIAGQHPFTGVIDRAILYNVINVDPQPVAGLRPGVPLQLAHLIDKTLAKSPEARYQHMSDLLAELRIIQQRQEARSLANHYFLTPEPEAITQPDAPPVALDHPPPVKILVVDDEPELELMIQQKFRREIYDQTWIFSFATSGKEALQQLQAHPDISLVLTDLNMPGMDGLTLLGRIADFNRPLKAVVVSAYGDIKNIRTAMNRGAFDFLTKPINLGDLETTIHKTLAELKVYHEAAESRRQAAAMQQELEVARRIQEANLPLPLPRRQDLELYAFSTTGCAVGGTFYDYFLIGDDHVGFLIGDVAGRGVSAALFTAMSQTFLRRIAEQGEAPGACLSAMNRLLFPEGYIDLSVSVFFGLLDTQTGIVTYASAGHPAPYLLNGGPITPLGGAEEAPVWQHADQNYPTRQATLQPGEGLFLYTPGVVRATNEQGHPFASDRLATRLMEAQGTDPARLIRNVVRAVMQHTNGTPLADDLTVLALRYHGPQIPL